MLAVRSDLNAVFLLNCHPCATQVYPRGAFTKLRLSVFLPRVWDGCNSRCRIFREEKRANPAGS